MVNFTDAVLQDVTFEGSRLTGVNFSVVQLGALGIQVTFQDADLSFCSFRNMDLTACRFKGSVAREADFQRCDLEKVVFEACDLDRCVFNGNNLKFADLRSARNYSISAFDNRIRGMRVALPEAINLLAALEVDVQ